MIRHTRKRETERDVSTLFIFSSFSDSSSFCSASKREFFRSLSFARDTLGNISRLRFEPKLFLLFSRSLSSSPLVSPFLFSRPLPLLLTASLSRLSSRASRAELFFPILRLPRASRFSSRLYVIDHLLLRERQPSRK